jgi:heparin binding hemagglutinin HbhA
MARTRNRNANPTALYAVIGVGDLAVEKIRYASTELQTLSKDLQARTARISLEPKKLQADLEAAQGQAQSVFTDALGQAVTTFDDLAGRGRSLVTRIQRQKSVRDLVASVGTTKAQAKGAATTARKSASTTASTAKKDASSATSTARKSASSTRSQAKKSASRTQSRTKAAGTSARKTAQTAGTAAKQSAEKVGD